MSHAPGGSSPTTWPPGALDPVQVDRDRIVALHSDGSVARTRPVRPLGVRFQDAVLRAEGGPVWLIIVNGQATGLEVQGCAGEHSAYEQACDELVSQGLLTKGNTRAGSGPCYTFTKRGQVARWALEEFQRIESDRRSGRSTHNLESS